MGTPGQRGHSVAGMSRACYFDSGSIQMSASRKKASHCDGANQKGPFCEGWAVQALELRTTLLMSLLMNHQDLSNSLMRSFTQVLRCADKEFWSGHSKQWHMWFLNIFHFISGFSHLWDIQGWSTPCLLIALRGDKSLQTEMCFLAKWVIHSKNDVDRVTIYL